MPGVGERAVELDQERLEADPQLQGRLAVAAGVEVGAGAQQQRLAGVDPLAPAEHGGDPLLRPQLLGARRAARGAGRPDVDVAGRRVAAGGDLFAAAVADPHRDRARGGQFADVGVGGRRAPGRRGRG